MLHLTQKTMTNLLAFADAIEGKEGEELRAAIIGFAGSGSAGSATAGPASDADDSGDHAAQVETPQKVATSAESARTEKAWKVWPGAMWRARFRDWLSKEHSDLENQMLILKAEQQRDYPMFEAVYGTPCDTDFQDRFTYICFEIARLEYEMTVFRPVYLAVASRPEETKVVVDLTDARVRLLWERFVAGRPDVKHLAHAVAASRIAGGTVAPSPC